MRQSGFNAEQIRLIGDMILATSLDIEPVGLLQEIICDADHDYLGRADYYVVASKLKEEMIAFGHDLSEEEWIQMQIRFLGEQHQFYTVTALNIRQKGKMNRLAELKTALTELQNQQV